MRLPHEHLTAGRMKPRQMRSVNGIGLLNLIAEHGPISRASLAKLSRLSKPTVSSQMEALIRRGWVVEVGPGQSGSQGGKKPTLVRFNANAGRLFAAEIESAEVRVAVADLEGKIRARSCRALEDRSAEAVMDTVRRELGKLIRRHSPPGIQRVISVAAPGRVDVRRGLVLEAGNLFNWRNVPVRGILELAFGIPVFVDNDVNMATLGELHFGAAQGQRNVVVVRLDTGIGSGIVVRGRLHHGTRWAAGEIAHMILDLSQAGGDWTTRGYLESMIAADRIIANCGAAAGGTRSAVEVLRDCRHASGERRAVFDGIVLHAGIAIANLICAYDPSIVVLQGDLLGEIAGELQDVIRRAVPWETKVLVSGLGEESVLLGTIVAARAQAYYRVARLIEEVPAPEDSNAAAPAAV